MCTFQYNDGGRAAAGYKGSTGDCVVRSIAIITGKPYKEVYDAINTLAPHEKKSKKKRGKSNARTGVHKDVYHKYLLSLGMKWTPTMLIGQGCKVHLRADELPKGKLIVSVSRHLTAVIDGVIHDTHNPSERGSTIYPLGYPKDQLPKGARLMENGNGYVYKPERCVYGYYSF